MRKGRPIGSEIRDNVVDIMFHMGKAYGYEIYQVYKNVFKPVTLRVIYYHLAQAVKLGLMKVEKVQVEEGDYSWGTTVEKKYYILTNQAKPRPNVHVKQFLEEHNMPKGQ